jgi:hypothetical protein
VRPKLLSVAICLSLLFASQAACNLSLLRKARRIDPIAGILDAFRTHQIVGLGEGIHGNNQAHVVRLALVRDPRFAAVVNDIVVEFGSAQYQPLMDRFVRGDDVPYAQLRKAWQDTTTAHAGWDLPIYEEFFRAVRDVNASLPGDRQLRVLLGDPPIDWSAVHTWQDVAGWLARRGHVVDVIKREVLSRNHRALVVYGDGHLRRYSRWRGSQGPAHPTLLNQIEAAGARAFAIWTNTTVELERLQKDIGTWPVPSLTLVRDTRLGALDFKYFAGMETDPPTKMQEQFDAVLYLGPVSSITFSELPAALCTDPDYTKMRLARMALGPGGPNGPDVVEFNRQCARFLTQSAK